MIKTTSHSPVLTPNPQVPEPITSPPITTFQVPEPHPEVVKIDLDPETPKPTTEPSEECEITPSHVPVGRVLPENQNTNPKDGLQIQVLVADRHRDNAA
jgi:hypothetical protein